MEKCKSYYVQRYIKGWKDGDSPILDREVGVCYGTKEQEECSCGGDRTKCNFYPEIKAKAQKEALENAIEYKISQAIIFLTQNGYKVTKE